jgi:acyl-CoA reductase-like NAD-dependent aldehyde dehydrogenase
MLHIPILRHGKPYESVEKVELVHHATGEPIAAVSQANSGMVVRDINRIDDTILERFSVGEHIDICKKAGERFVSGALPIGDQQQTYDEYILNLSATTGMPHSYCHANAQKIKRVLTEMHVVIAGLTRGFDLSIIDKGYGDNGGRTLSYFRDGRTFGAVLPSNSPGVHGLWIPAIALKAPIVLKPGREEPWTPLRIIEALAAAGIPREAFGFYPTDHAGAGELLRGVSRSMLFGGADTTAPWKGDPRVEIHGPGYSKVILGDDTADDWEKYVDIMAGSIAANGGRSCINASAIWTPRHGKAIAEALATRFAKIEPLAAEDPNAVIAAFANQAMATSMSEMIDFELKSPGAMDVTEKVRGSHRLVTKGRVSYVLPTIIWCEDREHALRNREFLFPFASVVECPTVEMASEIGSSLVVSAITKDQNLINALMTSPNVDRLNIGAIPTYQLSWDQPHEGNLFEHLYRQRAFQVDPAA